MTSWNLNQFCANHLMADEKNWRLSSKFFMNTLDNYCDYICWQHHPPSIPLSLMQTFHYKFQCEFMKYCNSGIFRCQEIFVLCQCYKYYKYENFFVIQYLIICHLVIFIRTLHLRKGQRQVQCLCCITSPLNPHSTLYYQTLPLNSKPTLKVMT